MLALGTDLLRLLSTSLLVKKPTFDAGSFSGGSFASAPATGHSSSKGKAAATATAESSCLPRAVRSGDAVDTFVLCCGCASVSGGWTGWHKFTAAVLLLLLFPVSRVLGAVALKTSFEGDFVKVAGDAFNIVAVVSDSVPSCTAFRSGQSQASLPRTVRLQDRACKSKCRSHSPRGAGSVNGFAVHNQQEVQGTHVAISILASFVKKRSKRADILPVGLHLPDPTTLPT